MGRKDKGLVFGFFFMLFCYVGRVEVWCFFYGEEDVGSYCLGIENELGWRDNKYILK